MGYIDDARPASAAEIATQRSGSFAPSISSISALSLFAPLILFTVKAFFVLRDGAQYGRLALPTPYDDATYFCDAMERIQILHSAGLLDFLRTFVMHPPHAPYSTIAAAIAFLFGVANASGPYFVNAVTLALLLTWLFALLNFRPATVLCCSLVVISLPWFDNAVTIFHPDLVAGLATAIVAASLIWQSQAMTTRFRTVLVGALAGLTLLIKPVAAHMEIALWGPAFIIGAIGAYRQKQSLGSLGLRVLLIALPTFIIAGPYFASELNTIIAYIYAGFVTERSTWIALSGAPDKTFYINQGHAMFGPWLVVAAACQIAVVCLCIGIKQWPTAWRISGLLFVTVLALAVPTAVDVKAQLFGSMFYGLIVISIVMLVHTCSELITPRLARTALVAAITAAAVLDLSDKQNVFADTDSKVAEYNDVYNQIKNIVTAEGKHSAAVYFPLPSPVAPHAYRFRGLTDGIDITPLITPHETDFSAVEHTALKATIVVIPDDRRLSAAYPYPINKLIPALREWAKGSDSLRLSTLVQSASGNIEIYRKQ